MLNHASFLAEVNALRRHYGKRRIPLALAITNLRRRYVKTRRNKADAPRWAIAVAFAA